MFWAWGIGTNELAYGLKMSFDGTGLTIPAIIAYNTGSTLWADFTYLKNSFINTQDKFVFNYCFFTDENTD